MPDETPTRQRFIVAFWLCSMAAVLYLDRICWSQAAPKIQKDFQLTNQQLAYLAMAFQLAYGLFEIPTGRWGEVIGARRVLTRITLWWSAFTALCGATNSFTSLLVVRFLFGAGEAGAYPNAARVLTRWFPSHERGRVQGIMLSVSLFGGAIAPTLAAYIIEAVGWKWNFVIFGSFGLVWAIGFYLWFRDTPAQHSGTNQAERELIEAGGGTTAPLHHGSVPWRQVLADPGVLILSLIIMCTSFNSYFYFTWFTSYLQKAHRVSDILSGQLTSVTLVGAAIGVLVGGIVADKLIKGSSAAFAKRRIFCSLACLLAACALVLAVRCQSVIYLATLAGLSCFMVQLTLPSWWSAAIERSGQHVGPIFGMMNMVGTFGAMASQWFVGFFADYQQSRGFSGRAQWDSMFYVYVGVLTLGACCWASYGAKPRSHRCQAVERRI